MRFCAVCSGMLHVGYSSLLVRRACGLCMRMCACAYIYYILYTLYKSRIVIVI